MTSQVAQLTVSAPRVDRVAGSEQANGVRPTPIASMPNMREGCATTLMRTKVSSLTEGTASLPAFHVNVEQESTSLPLTPSSHIVNGSEHHILGAARPRAQSAHVTAARPVPLINVTSPSYGQMKGSYPCNHAALASGQFEKQCIEDSRYIAGMISNVIIAPRYVAQTCTSTSMQQFEMHRKRSSVQTWEKTSPTSLNSLKIRELYHVKNATATVAGKIGVLSGLAHSADKLDREMVALQHAFVVAEKCHHTQLRRIQERDTKIVVSFESTRQHTGALAAELTKVRQTLDEHEEQIKTHKIDRILVDSSVGTDTAEVATSTEGMERKGKEMKLILAESTSQVFEKVEKQESEIAKLHLILDSLLRANKDLEMRVNELAKRKDAEEDRSESVAAAEITGAESIGSLRALEDVYLTTSASSGHRNSGDAASAKPDSMRQTPSCDAQADAEIATCQTVKTTTRNASAKPVSSDMRLKKSWLKRSRMADVLRSSTPERTELSLPIDEERPETDEECQGLQLQRKNHQMIVIDSDEDDFAKEAPKDGAICLPRVKVSSEERQERQMERKKRRKHEHRSPSTLKVKRVKPDYIPTSM